MRADTDYRVATRRVVRIVDKLFEDDGAYMVYARCPHFKRSPQQVVAYRAPLDGVFSAAGLRFVDGVVCDEIVKGFVGRTPPLKDRNDYGVEPRVRKALNRMGNAAVGVGGRTLTDYALVAVGAMVLNPLIAMLGLEVDQQEYIRRLTICKGCEYFQPVTKTSWRCRKCGCVGSVKARLRNAEGRMTCPLGKWDA